MPIAEQHSFQLANSPQTVGEFSGKEEFTLSLWSKAAFRLPFNSFTTLKLSDKSMLAVVLCHRNSNRSGFVLRSSPECKPMKLSTSI